MLLNIKTIKKLEVETENGLALGEIVDIEIDTANHNVVKYLAAKSKFLNATNRLMISPAQIIRVTENKMIVQDTLEPIIETQSNLKPLTINESPAMNSIKN